jgi:tetratricopeptide (TPR) repeat protein
MSGPQADLGTLEASGLIKVVATQPDLEYLFKHALVQDAAYSSLLKQDRRTLHQLAAETLLAVYPERRGELAAVIALHFEQAGDNARAAEEFVNAGEHAIERFATREAVSSFTRALELLPADDARVDLRMRAAIGIAKSGWSFTGLGDAISQLEAALKAGEGRAGRKLVGDAYFWVAFLRRMRGETIESSPEMRYALEQTEAIGAELGDPAAHAIPKAFIGAGAMFGGELRKGAQLLGEALDAMLGKSDPLSTAILSGFLAITYARLGEFAEAEETLKRSGAMADDGDEIARLDQMIAWSALMLERGDIEEGSSLASRCASESEELGAVACGVASNVFLGQARLILEDPGGAKPALERGIELALVTFMAPMRTLGKGMLGSAKARLGDVAGGEAGWDAALADASRMHDAYGEAQTLWARARTRMRQADPDFQAALADLDVAIPLFERMEARPSIARIHRDRAQALRGVGRAAEADEADRRAREMAAELGLRDFKPV